MNASAAPFFSAVTDARACAVEQGTSCGGWTVNLSEDCLVAEDDAGASAGFVQPSLAVYITRENWGHPAGSHGNGVGYSRGRRGEQGGVEGWDRVSFYCTAGWINRQIDMFVKQLAIFFMTNCTINNNTIILV